MMSDNSHFINLIGVYGNHRPKAEEKRKNGWPSQRQRVMHEGFCSAEPHIYVAHDVPQERKRRPRGIQTSKPSAHSGGIGNAIGIFARRRRRFPGVIKQEIAPQRLAPGDQAVVAIRRRERRQEGFPAQTAKASADLNPVVIFVVGLFPPAAMTDDRIAQTQRALAKNRPSAGLGPIGFEVALRSRKCDKQYRDRGGSAGHADLAGI
jgi:hypothetical protein